jgi:uncharacterized membrane protein YphA (DoxX/SURF4 family)
MKKTTVLEIIIFFYAILFFYTGISKLMEYSVFKEQLGESPVLAPLASLIAATLPWLEFLVVIMLIIPRWRLKGLYITLTMMTGFTIYVIALLAFRDKLPCSCGGIISNLSWTQHVIFNTTFILLAIWGIIIQKQQAKANQSLWTPITQSGQSLVGKV